MNYLITYLQKPSSDSEPHEPTSLVESIGHMEIGTMNALPLALTSLESNSNVSRYSAQEEETGVDVALIHEDIRAKYSKLVPRSQLILQTQV